MEEIKKKKKSGVGKAFEADFKKSCEMYSNISWDRIKDVTGTDGRRFKSATNIADFILYKYPNQIYLELKTSSAPRFPLSRLTEDQFVGLVKKSWIPGVKAGIMVNFTVEEETWFLPIEYVQVAVEESEHKSIPIGEFRSYGTRLPGEKKRVRFKYDVARFLEVLCSAETTKE